MAPYPEWLHILSLAFLSFSFLCAAIIIIDELRPPSAENADHGFRLADLGNLFWTGGPCGATSGQAPR